MIFIRTVFNFALILPIFMLLMCTGCGSGSSTDSNNRNLGGNTDQGTVDLSQNLPVPNNQNSEKYTVILYGNSHIAGLSNLIETLLEVGKPNASYEFKNYGGGFLDESYASANARDVLVEGEWTHAIFQGQKYSQSQTIGYSTLDTQKWLDLAKSKGVTPILFPEHPQRGMPEEADYVHDIHQGIANKQSSCLAPVGLVWNRVQSLYPSTHLHISDGNHASYLGRFLTALVFYEVITGSPADLLEYIPQVSVPESVQANFGQVVSEVIAEHKACPWE